MENNFKIRPSARIITTIGKDLIKDVNAAIVELVKNSYDADATNVDIEFSVVNINNEQKIKIIIEDNGHGMSFDTVINKWMVPATDDKLKRKFSPKGRSLQGRKGIGRYAASILGEELFLATTDNNHHETSLFVDWRKFEEETFLENVEIIIEEKKTEKMQGTTIEIIGSNAKYREWTKREFEELKKELKKLLLPIQKFDKENYGKKNDDFDIIISFKGFPFDGYKDFRETITPFPLIELYDYRLYGNIFSSGIADLTYINNVNQEYREKINLELDFDKNNSFGNISFDIRVFDRDPESIENIILKGIKNNYFESGFGKAEAKKMINEMSGISIYRGDFRVRPYGDSEFDWLEMDKRRVQAPSIKIGINQVAGFIEIESEEKSNLLEKSARDGLKDNRSYRLLKETLIKIIAELENRRHDYRVKSGRGRSLKGFSENLQTVFDFSEFRNDIENVLIKSKVDAKKITEITEFIDKDKQKRSEALKRIEETFAMYRGQVTLGKIAMVVMHEGRKPISWFMNQEVVIKYLIQNLLSEFNQNYLDKVIDYLSESIEKSKQLSALFSKIDPLALRPSARRIEFNLKKQIESVFNIYENILKERKVNVIIKCDRNISFFGWKLDFNITLSNLVENSIYWLNNEKDPQIQIEVFLNKQMLIIDYYDNGKGIPSEYIETEKIFEPGISYKPEGNGTGLGLPIAGESAKRNNGFLKAIYSKNGAHFKIEYLIQKDGIKRG